MENKESFNYTYSAKEQEEIKRIRKKYTAPAAEEDKMAQLRRLDASVYSKATTVALVVGIIGALIMGLGMSLVMTDIGATLNIANTMTKGIVIGVIGMAMALINYPIYSGILNSRKKKYAPEILEMSDKIMNK